MTKSSATIDALAQHEKAKQTLEERRDFLLRFKTMTDEEQEEFDEIVAAVGTHEKTAPPV
jgi:hypothetical protein